jgi:integrase
MARERTGWIGQDDDGRWFYRYQYTDEFGKRRNVRRLATSESNAKSQLRKALNKHDDNGERGIEGERLRFSKLADEYAKRKVFEPEYQGDRKVAGLRSYQSVELLLETLKAHFADKRVASITHADVETFKLTRLRTPKSNGESRTIASVNRELACLRAVLRYAVRQGWLSRSPFAAGEPLISTADETRRERVLSRDEELRLLDACGERTLTYKRKGRFKGKKITVVDKGEKREHLRALIVAALDTAMRRGELFRLKWEDVDLERGVISIKAMNTKTARARTVFVTPRLREELTKLWEKSPKRLDLSVFGHDEHGSVRKAWLSACLHAKVKGCRFHDLRHTAITRMVAAGMPSAQIMKISGHTQTATFQRYVNPNEDDMAQAAKRMHEYHASNGARETASELVH